MKVTIIDSASKMTATYTVAPQVVGDETIYTAAGVPVTPPVIPPVIPPVTPPGNVKMGALNPQYQPLQFTLAPGQFGSFPLPMVGGAMVPAGYVQVIQSSSTPVSDYIEIWFSTTPGDVNDPLRQQVSPPNQFGPTNRHPCVVTYNYTGGPIKWSTTPQTDPSKVDPNVALLLPTPGVTYYVNYRHTGAMTAPMVNVCQWN